MLSHESAQINTGGNLVWVLLRNVQQNHSELLFKMHAIISRIMALQIDCSHGALQEQEIWLGLPSSGLRLSYHLHRAGEQRRVCELLMPVGEEEGHRKASLSPE